MTTLSHAAVGLLVSRYFIEQGLLPAGTATPYLLGLAFANLPDIDGALAPRHLYNHQNHLKSTSHYPANWLIVLGLVALLALPFRLRFILPYIGLAAVNVFLHFVLDTFSIYGGIAWLGPWKKKRYSFVKALPFFPKNNHEWAHWYTKHWVMYLEVALWVVALIVLIE